MHIRTPAIVCSARSHGETGVVARLLTADHGLVAAFVAGGRGRQLRPVLIPGNGVEAQITARGGFAMPTARLELTVSRGQWMGEPLAAAAIGWVSARTAATLPERQPFPALAQALEARGWTFYQMHGEPDYRFMCAWDTTPEDVDAFAKDVQEVAAGG